MHDSTLIPGCSPRPGIKIWRAFAGGISGLAAVWVFFSPALTAADTPATGAIEGRISNAVSGNYLNNAIVTIPGTNLETVSNDIGEYQLPNVPAGEVRIAVAFSGMVSQTAGATVAAGQVAHRDFALSLDGSDVVQMDKYTVSARELTGQAVADEERRSAPNIKSVISLDEFGDMGEGNIGEYLKYIPGVSLAYDPQRPQSASIRGMPASGTILTLNGAPVATSQNETRTFDLGVIAAGNVDRVEVSKEPTPDMPANAVGGMINVITKSGFSRSSPLLSYNLFLTASGVGGLGDVNYSLHKKPGTDPSTAGAPDRPAYNLSYILPVSKKLAFTFAVAQSNRPTDMEFLFTIWDQVKDIETYNRPSWAVFNEKRDLGAMSAIWKISDRNTLQASFQATDSNIQTRQFQSIVQTGAGAVGDPNSSQGAATAVGSAQQAVPWIDQLRSLEHGTLSYRYDGSAWEVNVNATWSQAGTKAQDTADGFFGSVSNTITGLIARYDGINAIGERKAAIDTATDKTGKPVNIDDGNSYSVTAANSGGPLHNINTSRQINADIRREFDLSVPVAVKVGALVSRNTSDTTGGAYGYSFAPPGGAAGQLAGNYDLIADSFSTSHAFEGANGAPINMNWLSPYKMYKLFQAHPEYFVFGPAQQAAQYVSMVTIHKKLQETIPAVYVRGDVKFFNNHLWLTGGVRFEQTRDDGEGPLNDIGATFQKDANGNNLLSSTGAFIPITTDPLATAKLQYRELGVQEQKTYQGFYPSLNTTYNFTPNLLARAAYARTIGRPDITSILPGTTISDSATAVNTITVVNTALKPWTANNYDVAVEAYDLRGATVSVSGYRKDLKNFFGSVTSPATAALLAANGLPTDTYLGYNLVTMQNFGAATIQGIEFAYRQSLAPFVPSWAKGFEFYGNVTTQTLSGANAASFTTFSPHEASWGFSYGLPRFIAKINVQQSGWIRGSAAAASATVPPNAYNYTAPQTRVDVSAEYRLTRIFSLYGSVRNLTHTPKRQGIKGPGIADFTVLDYYQYTGTLVTMGIKGDF